MTICEFVELIIPNTNGKIQSYAAIITAFTAVIALVTWKYQKKFDINLEATSKIPLIKSIILHEIFEIQEALELVRDVNNSGVLDKEIMKNTSKKFLDISEKYEQQLSDVNFHSHLYLIKANLIKSDKFKPTHRFYLEVDKIKEQHIDVPLTKFIIDHVDNKKNINPTNYLESMEEFKFYSTGILVEGWHKFSALFKDMDI